MNINQAFPSKYLRATDLNGGDLAVTIREVTIEDVGTAQKKERKPVVYFVAQEKGMVLNKTNAAMITAIAKSDDTDEWTGVKIRLIAAEVEYQGTLTMALRVRAPLKAQKPQPVDVDENAGALSADDIPF